MAARTIRPLAALLCALVAVTTLTTLATARPASAQTTELPRPVLLVGGFLSQQWFMDWWAEELARRTETPVNRVAGVDLTLGGLVSNEVSANGPILDEVNRLYAAHGEKIDIVATSQGALAARWLLKNNASARDKVAGFISLGGVNAGGPFDPDSDIGRACGEPDDWEDWPRICQEVFYRPWEGEGPGETPWLLALNSGDPTPGNIAYYHVYTELTDDGPALPPEAYEPYGWGQPLLGARNVSAQDACAIHGYGNRPAPHAALWDFDPVEWDSVQTELVLDALHRRDPPTIDAASTCAGR